MIMVKFSGGLNIEKVGKWLNNKKTHWLDQCVFYISNTSIYVSFTPNSCASSRVGNQISNW
jgi:hypothetical protein